MGRVCEAAALLTGGLAAPSTHAHALVSQVGRVCDAATVLTRVRPYAGRYSITLSLFAIFVTVKTLSYFGILDLAD